MTNVRAPDLAGSWYPGNERDCRNSIESFLDDNISLCEGRDIKGGIVPHAGWFYSGKIACNVIQCMSKGPQPETCIIFGRHLHPGGSNYIMITGKWATPLGDLEIDSELGTRLASEFSFTVETAEQYEPDNTIELQLPFIKYFFPDVKILPVGLPPKMESLDIAARSIDISTELGRKTIVVGSTDLTHYGNNYGYSPKGSGSEAVRWVKEVNDKRMVELMLELNESGVIYESLKNQNACCSGAVGGAIAAAKKLGASNAEKVLYSTSYDIRPDRSFVGYVGIIFYAS